MGKKRIIQKTDLTTDEGRASAARASVVKKKLTEGIAHIQSTYNNTIIAISDLKGNVIVSSSAGALGFRGAKKGTPYAAIKVAEFLGEKSRSAGLQSLHILINGVGAGREAALRSFAAQGFDIRLIRDVTPAPHNGPRQKKPRRV
ncbi:MAG TPA: 30S ribosomal protein S11 [Candidatus Paceibacterota bacterium]